MARKIHFSRLLDIISGSALAGANNKVQKSALYKDFDVAKLESKRLRELIDANLPTFYIVDTSTIVYTLVQGLGLNNFVENEEYIASKYPSKAELLIFLEKTVKAAVEKLPKKNFSDTLDSLNTSYTKLLDTLAKRSSYTGYRNAATRFGAELRTILKSAGVYIAQDGPSIVASLKPGQYVIIGPSFNLAVEKVNSLLNDDLRKAFTETYDISLRGYSKDPNNRFTIGDFVNAGHTAAYAGTGDLIGVNMPAAQEKQFLLSGDPKAEGLETSIADLYLRADYGITFTQNYTESAKTLLDMQFSFVVTMPQKFNTATLRTQEVARIKKYIGDTVLPDIVEQAKKKFSGGLVTDIVINSSASPSLYEYVFDKIRNTIKGDSTPDIVKANKSKKVLQEAIPIQAIVKDVSKKIKSKAKSGAVQIKPQKLPKATTQGSLVGLDKLLALLNSNLFSAITKNMGDGTRSDVLNYRTGRFARSVNVERLSISRQGMITAFYTYMKNPYATFSQGGKQSNPTSRDPKLLISKSIREIAQQQVANRLRAVSI